MVTSDFFRFQAQTTPFPYALSISKAKGCYIYDDRGKKYLDLVAGVSACSLGHRHPAVVKAIKKQLRKYLHVMVYGEYIQSAPVELCKRLAEALPDPLETTYLTNSGTEAIDGALKLARRATGRTEILAMNQAYHGNTYGALSVMGYESRKKPFEPLLPDVEFIQFNAFDHLSKITTKTAAVIAETIQGGAGFILPIEGYLEALRARCTEVGALLILDEIQPGMGRTGTLFGFEHYNCTPDIVVLGKGLGGGMPIGAFTASRELMYNLADNPILGHITTFGGHPVIAAAALATLKVLTESPLMNAISDKEQLVREHLKHPLISEIRGKGLMLAAMLPSEESVQWVIKDCLNRGLILFGLLYESKALRITPPLTISQKQLRQGCSIILNSLDAYHSRS